MTIESRTIPRPAARVLLDQSDRLLLPHSVVSYGQEPDLWITVGGALDPGETHEEAALRELWEETGLTGVKLGPWVWNRRHVYQWRGQQYEAIERFFLARTEAFEIAPAALDPIEAAELRGHKWWSVADIQAASGVDTFVQGDLVSYCLLC